MPYCEGAETEAILKLRPWVGALVLLAVWAGPAAAKSVIGDWAGVYDCAQGKTALELEITGLDKTQIQALFYFHAVPENPHVPAGCFLMTGTFDELSGQLQLRPGKWLLRPDGFVTVGMTGTLDASDRLSGSISGPGCKDFTLTRTDTGAAKPAPCKGQLLVS